MTCEEVNAKIAEMRGWTFEPYVITGNRMTGGTWDANGDADFRESADCRRSMPDFTGEWAWAGPLLEEMRPLGVSCDTTSLDGGDEWAVSWHEDHFVHERCADSATEAIARAWLAWKERT
jgi:hypothetical protein